MIRRALFDLLLFLLPFAAYALYVRFAPARAETAPERITPWTVLTVSGLVLVIASFLWLGLTEGAGTTGTYIAPHVENGQIVPGRVDKSPSP